MSQGWATPWLPLKKCWPQLVSWREAEACKGEWKFLKRINWNVTLGPADPQLSWATKWCDCSRRAFSQFWSFKIRRMTFMNYIKFADPRILRLWNCESFRRVLDQKMPKEKKKMTISCLFLKQKQKLVLSCCSLRVVIPHNFCELALLIID